MIGPVCPVCGHTAHPTQAIGRFDGTPHGYIAAFPTARLRATRAEAIADQCTWQARDLPDDPAPDPRDPLPGQEAML